MYNQKPMRYVSQGFLFTKFLNKPFIYIKNLATSDTHEPILCTYSQDFVRTCEVWLQPTTQSSMKQA